MLFGALAMGAAMLMPIFSKQRMNIETKLAALERRNFLDSMLTDTNLCTCNLSSALNTESGTFLKINPASPVPFEIKSIRSSCDFSPTANNRVVEEGQDVGSGTTQIKVDKIQLAEIAYTGQTDEYTAVIRVDYSRASVGWSDFTNSRVRFKIDSKSGKPDLRPISECMGLTDGNLGYLTCPAGYSLIYGAGKLNNSCVENTPRSAKSWIDAEKDCSSVSIAGYRRGKICDGNQFWRACVEGIVDYYGPNEWTLWIDAGTQKGPTPTGLNVYGRTWSPWTWGYVQHEDLKTPMVYRCCL